MPTPSPTGTVPSFVQSRKRERFLPKAPLHDPDEQAKVEYGVAVYPEQIQTGDDARQPPEVLPAQG